MQCALLPIYMYFEGHYAGPFVGVLQDKGGK